MNDIDKKDLALRVAERLETAGRPFVRKSISLPNDEAHALASILREYAGGGWQPISTAPKDGSHMLLWSGHRIVIGRWSDEALAKRPKPFWVTSSGAYGLLGVSWDRENPPTHWMPLPAHPEEA